MIAAKHADEWCTVFGKLYEARFPLQRMELVSAYGGDDEQSMAANNTSGFNYRKVTGATRWSQHALGAAIDVNPVQNPYVTGAGVSPGAGGITPTPPTVAPPSRGSSSPTRSSWKPSATSGGSGAATGPARRTPALLRCRLLTDPGRRA